VNHCEKLPDGRIFIYGSGYLSPDGESLTFLQRREPQAFYGGIGSIKLSDGKFLDWTCASLPKETTVKVSDENGIPIIKLQISCKIERIKELNNRHIVILSTDSLILLDENFNVLSYCKHHKEQYGSFENIGTIDATISLDRLSDVISTIEGVVPVITQESFIMETPVSLRFVDISEAPIDSKPLKIIPCPGPVAQKEKFFKSLGEATCHKIFRNFIKSEIRVNKRDYGIVFPETGYELELDLYDPVTKIAIEFNGKQHYEYVPFFHQTQERFEAQKRRDAYKVQRCTELGIKLIIIPWYQANIERYLLSELIRLI
jgi:hypothetical protein